MDHTPSAEQATARCRATDKTLHQRRAQPCAADARNGGGARWDAKPEQEAKELLALVVPAAPNLSGEHDEPLRAAAREFRVACDFAAGGQRRGRPPRARQPRELGGLHE